MIKEESTSWRGEIQWSGEGKKWFYIGNNDEYIGENDVMNSKHYATRMAYVRETIKAGAINIQYVPSG